jgi:hypothetical protein
LAGFFFAEQQVGNALAALLDGRIFQTAIPLPAYS